MLHRHTMNVARFFPNLRLSKRARREQVATIVEDEALDRICMSNAVAKALLVEKRVAELGNLLARGNVIEMNLVCTAAGEKRPVRTEGDGVGWV